MPNMEGPRRGEDSDITPFLSFMQGTACVPANMTGSIPGSRGSPRMVSSGNPGGLPSQVANETFINDSATRQVSTIGEPPQVHADAKTEAEAEEAGTPGATGVVGGEVLGDLQIRIGSSSSRSITSIPVGDGGLGLQLSASSGVRDSVETSSESEGGLGLDGFVGSDEEGTDFGRDGSSSLDRTSVVVQLSVRYDNECAESPAPFVPASWGGEGPPTETRSMFSSRCVDEYRASRRPRLVLDPEATASDRRALVNDIAHWGDAPGAGPVSSYPAKIKETDDELKKERR